MTKASVDDIYESTNILRSRILEVARVTENLTGDADPSPCSKVLNIENIITQKLQSVLLERSP